MEQRRQVRKPADLGAVVSCPQFGLFRGQIENLSSQGMYVRTSNVAICLNAPVTVTFQPEPEQPLRNCNAGGVVVHQDRNGFGIRFANLKRECRQALHGLLDDLPDTGESALGSGRLAV